MTVTPVRRLLVVALATAVAVVAVATAVADDYQRATVPADQAAAKAAVVQRGDLASGLFKGGLTKSDGTPLTCSYYNPTLSDLVVTGRGSSHWSATGVDITSNVDMLQTPQMVAIDWSRSFGRQLPQALRCLRETLAKETGANAKMSAFARIPFPRVGDRSLAVRSVIDATTSGTTVKLLVDVVTFTRDRGEGTLLVIAPYALRAQVRDMDVTLARLMASRMHRRLSARTIGR